MTDRVVERSRTGWDIVFGVLLVIAGLIILGNVVVATVVSVLFISWLTLVSGVIALVAALFRIGKGGFWPTLLSGALLTVLGLVFLRNTGAAALTLTLIAGTLFLVGGITRLFAALHDEAYRWPLLISGIASTILGLIVLFNMFEATLTLLGVLLGIETLIDGITLLLVGRVRVTGVLATTGTDDSAATRHRRA
jgi:membrane protein HdeD